MRISILGPPELHDETRLRRQLTSPKQGALLGALLAEPNTSVPAVRLIHELWGAHPPAKAENALQAHVSRLRQTLLLLEPEHSNAPRLVTRGSGYMLRVRPGETDAGHFCQTVDRAAQQIDRDPRAAYERLRQALALWRGCALEGSGRGPLCKAIVESLEAKRMRALELFFDAALRTGRHRELLPKIEETARAHPGRERVHELLAVARERCGRQNGAAAPDTRASGRHGASATSAPSPPRVPIASPQQRERTEPWSGDAELARLRGQVNLIALEQRSLRNRLEQLTTMLDGQLTRFHQAGGRRTTSPG